MRGAAQVVIMVRVTVVERGGGCDLVKLMKGRRWFGMVVGCETVRGLMSGWCDERGRWELWVTEMWRQRGG